MAIHSHVASCPECGRTFSCARKLTEAAKAKRLAWMLKQHECKARQALGSSESGSAPNWTKPCENCGCTPTVQETGLCGPCTFGEADTAGGNW